MRGQATIEYLMTYGWAILALIIVLGVLVFSGLLSPTYLISEECNFGVKVTNTFSPWEKADTGLKTTVFFSSTIVTSPV